MSWPDCPSRTWPPPPPTGSYSWRRCSVRPLYFRRQRLCRRPQERRRYWSVWNQSVGPLLQQPPVSNNNTNFFIRFFTVQTYKLQRQFPTRIVGNSGLLTNLFTPGENWYRFLYDNDFDQSTVTSRSCKKLKAVCLKNSC